MPRLSCLVLVVFVAACGMKGDLYENPPPPADETPLAEPASGDTDKGERRTIPAVPDPALSR
jgi:predicted small lipoprotein YifL